MDKLPSVSAFEIKKKLNNSQDRFYGKSSFLEDNSKSIKAKINDIFSSKNFVYKSRCKIFLESDVKEATIVGKTDNYLLTITNEKIKISDIKNIIKL